MITKSSKIFVAGHRGLVGSAVVRELKKLGYTNVICRTHLELDLKRQAMTEGFFERESPEAVVLCAARVGGIIANSTYPSDFIVDNLLISTNVINSAWKYGVKRLVNLGSNCIYPKICPQPIKEEYLLNGPLEPTNEPYAVAKIAALKLCAAMRKQHGREFASLMPANLYGPGDNYHPENSHVIPGLFRKFQEAMKNGTAPVLWGDGTPRREFLHSEDLARAIILMMEMPSENFANIGECVNVASGEEMTIRELSELVAKTVGYEGEILWDSSKPNGTPRKLLDCSVIRSLGWTPEITLEQGLKETWAEITS